jgi:hypothetical protein
MRPDKFYPEGYAKFNDFLMREMVHFSRLYESIRQGRGPTSAYPDSISYSITERKAALSNSSSNIFFY